ncbi:MAG: TraB/GumN family protein [Bacteroidales bacterium]|nr:TraB/GumN family protein [Bacteroidales bacterium]
MRTSVLSVLIINLIGNAFSQSLLWKISGNGLKEDSYLYGTIHIQDNRVFLYGDTVLNAFNNCNAYAMEVVIDEIDKSALEEVIYLKEGSIKDYLSDEEYQKLDDYCKEKIGAGLEMLKKMKPFFLSSQLMQVDMPKDRPLALDADFLNMARKQGKLVLGIEELSDQLGAIDEIPVEEQVNMLMANVNDTMKAQNQFEALIDAYLLGDFESIQTLMADTSLPKEFEEAMLIKRNKGMAKNIAKYIKKQSTFNAIGAAHLPGEKGVIALLRKKGFTVEPVPFTFNKQ